MPKKILPMLTEADHAMIARALYEASRLHTSGYDPERQEDPEIGRTMKGLLQSRYPDADRAFADADHLREALTKGYLPPPGGATPESVRTFLDQKRSTSRKSEHMPAYPGFDPNSDLPF